jgi:hypothetical protein
MLLPKSHNGRLKKSLLGKFLKRTAVKDLVIALASAETVSMLG